MPLFPFIDVPGGNWPGTAKVTDRIRCSAQFDFRRSLRSAIALCAFAAGLISAHAQTYSFSTWAGRSPQGHADGVGRAALFDGPRDVAIDASGNLFVADTGNRVIRKITPGGVVSTFAGMPREAGSNDGPGVVARFTNPGGITVDRAGNVYVTDNATIRKVTAAGLVTTVAGRAGETGSADGRGLAARFNVGVSPYANDGGLAADGDGNIYVADGGNYTIRKMTADGVVTTIAGGTGQWWGWNQPTAVNRDTARFRMPVRLTVDGTGSIFVADNYDGVRKISPDGMVTTLVIPDLYGNVQGVAVDPAGSMYVLRSDDGDGGDGGEVIAMSPAGEVTHLAGSDRMEAGSEDGTCNAARFFNPKGFTRDPSGNIFVADTANHAIRRIAADGVVTTVAGASLISVDASGRAARFRSPRGVAIDPVGNVYVSDRDAIRKITPGGAVTTVASAPTLAGPYWWAAVHLAVDGSGTIFASDSGNGLLHKVSPSGMVGIVATFGPDATPTGLAADRAGNVFFTSLDYTVKKMTPDGRITILAGDPRTAGGIGGSADGVGATARFNYPTGVAVNSRGDLFIADSGNHSIRMISPAGVVSTVAGAAGQRGRQDGIGIAARFSALSSIAVDSGDNIFVTDDGTLRKITNGIVTTLPAAWNEGIRTPTSLAVDASGAIYTADPFYHTVSKGISLSTSAESCLW